VDNVDVSMAWENNGENINTLSKGAGY